MIAAARVVAAAALATALLAPLHGREQHAATPAVPHGALQFVEASSRAGLTFLHTSGASPEKHLAETMGSGGLFFDYDGDGWLDVLLVDGGSIADPALAARARHRLFHNRGNGTFEDVTTRASLGHGGYGMGVCAGDYDNDGRVDVYLTHQGDNRLYRNRADGVFDDVTGRAGVAAPGWSTSCAFADLDLDGDLDLFVTNYSALEDEEPFCGNASLRLRMYCHPLLYDPVPSTLYRNDGNGRFTDVSDETGVSRYFAYGLGVVIADFDNDGRPDVFVANDSVPNYLFFNEGGWRFTEGALASGVAVAPDGRPRAGMGTDAADYDGDGLLDLVVTNHEFETHGLYRNAGDRLFTYATVESGIGTATLPYVGFGVAFFDADNDTHPDVVIVNGHVLDNVAQMRGGAHHAQRKLLFRNGGRRRFAEIGASTGTAFTTAHVGRGLAAGDVDNDGDVDLLVTNNGGPAELLLNETPHDGHALTVRLAGRQSNRDAIGARVRVVAGGQTLVQEVKAGSSYLSQNDRRLHIGLGPASSIDRLEVRWPAGGTSTFSGIRAGQIVTIIEGEEGFEGVAFVR